MTQINLSLKYYKIKLFLTKYIVKRRNNTKNELINKSYLINKLLVANILNNTL